MPQHPTDACLKVKYTGKSMFYHSQYTQPLCKGIIEISIIELRMSMFCHGHRPIIVLPHNEHDHSTNYLV